VLLNQLFENVLEGNKDLEEISEKSFYGSVSIGSVELSGFFSSGHNGDYAYMLLENGSLFMGPTANDSIFTGDEAGIRVSRANIAVLFDRDIGGFAITGEGKLNSYGSDLNLTSFDEDNDETTSVRVSWNELDERIDNLTLEAGGLSRDVNNLEQDSAQIIGEEIFMRSDEVVMELSLSVNLPQQNSNELSLVVSDGEILFSDSPRTDVALEEINGKIQIDSNKDLVIDFAGTLIKSNFNGLTIPQMDVDLDYVVDDIGNRRFLISGDTSNTNSSMTLVDLPAQGKFEFYASESQFSGHEYIFAFSEISIEAEDLSLADGSGAILANVNGVVMQLFGLANLAFEKYSAGDRLSVKGNTTQSAIDRGIPFQDGNIDLEFSDEESSVNYFKVSHEDAHLTIGDRLQIRGALSWHDDVIDVDGDEYEVETSITSSCQDNAPLI
jgi:hypothetical protein